MKTSILPLAMIATIVSLSACTKAPCPEPDQPTIQAPVHARTLDTTRHMEIPLSPELPRVPKGEGI